MAMVIKTFFFSCLLFVGSVLSASHGERYLTAFSPFAVCKMLGSMSDGDRIIASSIRVNAATKSNEAAEWDCEKCTGGFSLKKGHKLIEIIIPDDKKIDGAMVLMCSMLEDGMEPDRVNLVIKKRKSSFCINGKWIEDEEYFLIGKFSNDYEFKIIKDGASK